MRLDATFLCGHMKSRRAINAVAIQQSHRRHFHLSAGADQLFRRRSTFEKTERRPRMKLYVFGHSFIHHEITKTAKTSTHCLTLTAHWPQSYVPSTNHSSL